MINIEHISRDSLEFPDTGQALTYPNGLLAVGGDLSLDRLLNAYRRGIFPWYEDPQPILWWSPDPRSVLYPDEIRISRSLTRTLRKNRFRVTTDRAFHRVLAGCAAPRARERGTWITNSMARAYMDLHRQGYAHSVEVWDEQNQLQGGLYGVALGRVFFGESMFSRVSDASKVALLALTREIPRRGFSVIDCQVESEHLNSMGARNIPRVDFEKFLAQTAEEHPQGHWDVDVSAGELL
ncbi:MAG: leucyl/phenylalanyl-tRNA--protein transferase [Halieaceae bacterium]|jgi:leucyl/phenylalanyl-tRNA--protein transferase|nr:leucyl/phenylalanyl-tRNA--protein transferase [Halieaceae bacterium]